jgi:hypothetical protein
MELCGDKLLLKLPLQPLQAFDVSGLLLVYPEAPSMGVQEAAVCCGGYMLLLLWWCRV